MLAKSLSREENSMTNCYEKNVLGLLTK